MTFFTYVVTFKPEGVATDITNFVERVDAVDIGTGQVRNLKLRLNATDGAFITNKDFTGTDSTPLIDQFDKIRVQITDRDSNVFDETFEVDNTKPIQNGQVGIVFEVEALGMEHWLQKVLFAKPFFQESGFTVARDIIDFYLDPNSKGTLQATIIDHKDTFANSEFNDLPQFTANVYPYNITDQTVYDGLLQTVDQMGSSVGSGGAGDFFEYGFLDDLTDGAFNTVKFRGFSSGNPADQSSVPTIDDSVAVNPGEEEGGLEAIKGTVRGTWGADGIGKLPRQNADFIGALEIWNQFPEHVSPGITYPNGSIIENRGFNDSDGDFFHFKANKDTVIAPPTPPTTSNADWDQYFFTTFVTTEAGVDTPPANGQYSRWTNDRADEWKSSGAKVDGTVGDDPPLVTSVHCWDMNLVVVDGNFARTWADCRAISPAGIPSQLLYPSTGIYRGFRVLVDTTLGAPSGDFVGFDDEVIQFNGLVWRTHRAFANDAMCAIDNEAKVYQLQAGTWTDFSSDGQGNDCYHAVFQIGNDQGVNNHNDGLGGNYGDSSGVTYEFRYSLSDVTSFNVPKYYRMGAWINWRVPFPSNSFNFNTLGELYGKATGNFEPSTLDAGNMHFTSNGNIGFNNTDAESLGPLDAIEITSKFLWTYGKDGLGAAVRAGNFECRCVMYDSSDNVVTQDFVIPFNGEFTQTISLAFADFKIYRGRKPWSVIDLASNIFLQKLEILNRFEFKNIQKIGLIWLGPYDDEGRYQPWGQIGFLFPALENIFTGIVVDGYNLKWEIDSWQFSKPGLSISAPDTSRAIQPRFNNETQIVNKFTLNQSNDANLEISTFRHVQYEIVTEGLCDLRFGDSIFLENSDLVREANRNETSPGANDGDLNTIKLVCKKIRYEITKSPQGPGGFLRYITGVKRFITP